MRRLCLVLLAACGTSPSPAPASPSASRDEVVFHGMCDASGAVALSGQRLLVADDEDNVLRVYDADRGGDPLTTTDVSEALGLAPKGKKKRKFPELDLEAATTLGDRAYWITSHGRNSKGRVEPARLRIFATTIAEAAEVVSDYDALLDDLLADPRYADLAAASALAPKAPGGLNIEGLTATPEGTLLIGFRSPTPGDLALIVPLLDPAALLAGAGPAQFGDPIRLDLGGLGVRSMSWWRGRYLIIAGASGEGGGSALYTWDGGAAPVATGVPLAGFNPEGFFSPEDRDDILVLSDDGTVAIDGVPCKKLDDPARKRFRGAWIRIAD